MPFWQTERVLVTSLGARWRELFQSFSEIPFASASIGQVHEGVTLDGRPVAVKIQFPGVAQSLKSDLSNLRMLLSATALLPKGLYLDNTIKVMERELADECDYSREAQAAKRFAHLLRNDDAFDVPAVVDELCGHQVLTTQRMQGTTLSKANELPQTSRDLVCRLGYCFATC